MALSLPGERSVAAGSLFSPLRALVRSVVKANTARRNRAMVKELWHLEPHRLRDLGIERHDISEAIHTDGCRTPGMVLAAARARAAKS